MASPHVTHKQLLGFPMLTIAGVSRGSYCRRTCNCLFGEYFWSPNLCYFGLYLEKAKEANDVLRRGQKERSKQSMTNKFKFIFQLYMQ